MKGDLHIHSYYSDGLFAPAFVVEKAKNSGCDFCALTDHDTVEGIPEADEAAAKLGLLHIHGVEISTYADGREVHVLGYGMDIRNAGFLEFLRGQQERRRVRASKMLEKLALHGIEISADYIAERTYSVITRSHIARAITDLGYEPDFFTAISKWLRYDSPTYVPNDGLAPEEAIAAIHAAGGLAVLAHPVRLWTEPQVRAAFIKRLADAGLDGLEAVYKRSVPQDVRAFRRLAKQNGLFITAGADFHGEGQEIMPRKVIPPFIGKNN